MASGVSRIPRTQAPNKVHVPRARQSWEQIAILRQSAGLDWTAKVVCEACNNGWMKLIERDHAMPTITPIIKGSPICLLPSGIASLAVFAFKLAVVADHMHSRRAPFFRPSIRTAFHDSLRIPLGVQMWLSAYHSATPRNAGLFNTYYFKIRGGRYKGFEGLCRYPRHHAVPATSHCLPMDQADTKTRGHPQSHPARALERYRHAVLAEHWSARHVAAS